MLHDTLPAHLGPSQSSARTDLLTTNSLRRQTAGITTQQTGPLSFAPTEEPPAQTHQRSIIQRSTRRQSGLRGSCMTGQATRSQSGRGMLWTCRDATVQPLAVNGRSPLSPAVPDAIAGRGGECPDPPDGPAIARDGGKTDSYSRLRPKGDVHFSS